MSDEAYLGLLENTHGHGMSHEPGEHGFRHWCVLGDFTK